MTAKYHTLSKSEYFIGGRDWKYGSSVWDVPQRTRARLHMRIDISFRIKDFVTVLHPCHGMPWAVDPLQGRSGTVKPRGGIYQCSAQIILTLRHHGPLPARPMYLARSSLACSQYLESELQYGRHECQGYGTREGNLYSDRSGQ